MTHRVTFYFDRPDGTVGVAPIDGAGDALQLDLCACFLEHCSEVHLLSKVTVNSHTILVPPGTQDVRRKVTTFISFLLGQTNHGPI